MRTPWVNWKTGLLVAVIGVGVIAARSSSSDSEIHNASTASNFALVDPRPGQDDWPCLRGTDGRNVANCSQLPLEWDSTSLGSWAASIPGSGSSSPILWGSQVFLTTQDRRGRRISLNSLDRQTGHILWQTILHHNRHSQSQESVPACSTAACDGQRIFVIARVNQRLWLTAVDLKGSIAWQHDVGPYETKATSVTSPVFHKSLVIVSADQDKHGFVVALHRQTGEIIWRIKRSAGESFGSPVLATVAESSQLLLAGSNGVSSYDPSTGKALWTVRTTFGSVANSVAFDDQHVYAMKGHPNAELICVDASGSGDVTGTHIRWRLPQVGDGGTSPVVSGGLVYVLSEEGRVFCVNASTGKIEWTKQVKGTFSTSPVIAGDYLFCADDSGLAYYLTLGSSSPEVIENSLGTGITASPVFAGDSVYLRTANQLHKITAQSAEPVVEKPTGRRRL